MVDLIKIIGNVADLARKAEYDRNPNVILKRFAGSIPAGQNWATQWTYTVPANKLAIWMTGFLYIEGPIATAGRFASDNIQMSVDNWVNHGEVIFQRLDHGAAGFGVGAGLFQTWYIGMTLKAGHAIRGRTKNEDTVAHLLNVSATVLEFDE